MPTGRQTAKSVREEESLVVETPGRRAKECAKAGGRHKHACDGKTLR